MSRDRVLRIGGAFLAAAVLVVLALHQIAVVDHEVWLERSYLNRWAFRDVPSRRGALFDAKGRTLAVDVPGFDLELRYRDLRRRHPVGLALHGGNLLRLARLGEEAYSYERPRGLGQAVQDLLSVPVRWLDPDDPSEWLHIDALDRYRETPRSVGQDVRFYAARLVAELSGASPRRIAAELYTAARERRPGAVVDVLAPRIADALRLPVDDVDALRGELERRFGLRIDELQQLDARLELDEQVPASWPGLWAYLESRRESWKDWAKIERLRFAERDALTDADFWRWLHRRGDLPSDLDAWLARAGERRTLTVERWQADRELLRAHLVERLVEKIAEALQLVPEVELRDVGDRTEVVDELFRALGRLGGGPGSEAAALRAALHELDQRVARDSLLERIPVPSGDDGAASTDGEVAVEAPEPIPTLIDEARPRVVRSRLPYRFATWLGMLEERHPGLLLRASVRRATGHLPGREDLGGFGAYLGTVSAFTGEDLARREGSTPRNEAKRMLGRANQSGLFELDPSVAGALPDELEESLRADAAATLHGHFRLYGRVGRSGAEASLDRQLGGDPGLRFIERDKSARESRMFASLDVTRGRDITLTLDLDLQALADEAVRDLGADVGAADPAMERALVVLDARSGDVLAFSGRSRVQVVGADGERWAPVPTYPNRNPSLGSVVKPFVVLEYLDQLARGVELPPLSSFAHCDRRYGDSPGEPSLARTNECGGIHGPGSGDVVTTLSKSCNFFFYEAVRFAGPGFLDRAYARAGWQQHDTDFGDHYQDHVPGVSRLLRPARNHGTLGPYVQSIGYGTQVPALMVARAYAGLATGALPDVGLVADRERRSVPLRVRSEHLADVREGLRRCMIDGTGRHVGPRIQRLGLLPVAHGKSGTCVVRGESPKLDNAWFAMFLGTDEEAGLVLVAAAYQVEGGGGRVAAPMAVRFLEAVAERPRLAERYLGLRSAGERGR